MLLGRTPPDGGRSGRGRRESSSHERVMTDPITDAPRVRAPEFPAGLDWVNTGGRPLTLAELRGKIVFLDFWTYG